MSLLVKEELMREFSFYHINGKEYPYKDYDNCSIKNIKQKINKLSTIEILERGGFWKETYRDGTVTCSRCGEIGNVNWDFCPYCGSVNGEDGYSKHHIHMIRIVNPTEPIDELEE